MVLVVFVVHNDRIWLCDGLTVEVDKKVDLEQEQQISNEQDRKQTSPDSIQKYDILDGKGTLPTTPTQLTRPSSVLEALDTERGVLGSANRRILQARLGDRSKTSDSLSRSISTAVSSRLEANEKDSDKNSVIRRIAGAVDKNIFTQEMMMYLLCQIFQTVHVEQVHQWLENSPERDREYVVGLLRTALA